MAAADPARQTRELREAEELEAVFEAPVAVIYKHSPTCGLCTMAAEEVAVFMGANPDVPVYQVDVLRDRPLSLEIERRLEIRHESPQAIVFRRGEPVWDGSHRGVTADALERAAA